MVVDIINPLTIPQTTSSNGCCKIEISGHQGGNGNAGGITIEPPGSPFIWILGPNGVSTGSSIHRHIRDAFRSIGCPKCSLELVACSENNPSTLPPSWKGGADSQYCRRRDETRQFIADETGCEVIAPIETKDLGTEGASGRVYDLDLTKSLECGPRKMKCYSPTSYSSSNPITEADYLR